MMEMVTILSRGRQNSDLTIIQVTLVYSRVHATKNKPDRATMRPDCVSTCIDHVTYMERQMDEQTGETTEK